MEEPTHRAPPQSTYRLRFRFLGVLRACHSYNITQHPPTFPAPDEYQVGGTYSGVCISPHFQAHAEHRSSKGRLARWRTARAEREVRRGHEEEDGSAGSHQWIKMVRDVTAAVLQAGEDIRGPKSGWTIAHAPMPCLHLGGQRLWSQAFDPRIGLDKSPEQIRPDSRASHATWHRTYITQTEHSPSSSSQPS